MVEVMFCFCCLFINQNVVNIVEKYDGKFLTFSTLNHRTSFVLFLVIRWYGCCVDDVEQGPSIVLAEIKILKCLF